MTRAASKGFVLSEDLEKKRCVKRSCNGRMTLVLVSYDKPDPSKSRTVWEWECIKCGKHIIAREVL